MDEEAMVETLMEEDPSLTEDDARFIYERLYGDDDDDDLDW